MAYQTYQEEKKEALYFESLSQGEAIAHNLNVQGRYESHEDAAKCICHGSGYWLSDFDTWETCPVHYSTDKPHPEDIDY
jgi:hypothetical protein